MAGVWAKQKGIHTSTSLMTAASTGTTPGMGDTGDTLPPAALKAAIPGQGPKGNP
jgi:hypothetical protein